MENLVPNGTIQAVASRYSTCAIPAHIVIGITEKQLAEENGVQKQTLKHKPMGQKDAGRKKDFKIAYKNTFRAVSTKVGRPLHWGGGGDEGCIRILHTNSCSIILFVFS
jgi:hypothetical protein